MPNLSRITVYPIKSLDGHDLSTCTVLGTGALANDRRYALVDGWGKYISGKTCAAIHGIRATFSEDVQSVTLSYEGQERSFSIADEQDGLASWCGEILGKKCRLIENDEGGFPDDCEAPGPTLISTSSLEAVAGWFEGLDLVEARRRFRFNLELAESPAFWEDTLVPEGNTTEHQVRRFRLGDLVWQGRGICLRCVVPTRDSQDGTVTAGFARDFNRLREESLPDWSPVTRFDHFYRLGANTRLDSDVDAGSARCVLRVGDAIEVIN